MASWLDRSLVVQFECKSTTFFDKYKEKGPNLGPFFENI